MYTYERNPHSRAYIPYSLGTYYVQGGFFWASKECFIEISTALNNRIQVDLKHDIVAVWHVESHINRFIAEGNDIKTLESSKYCVTEEAGYIPSDTKILLRDKSKYFDVKKLKGTVRYNIFQRAIRKGYRIIHNSVYCYMDKIKRVSI